MKLLVRCQSWPLTLCVAFQNLAVDYTTRMHNDKQLIKHLGGLHLRLWLWLRSSSAGGCTCGALQFNDECLIAWKAPSVLLHAERQAMWLQVVAVAQFGGSATRESTELARRRLAAALQAGERGYVLSVSPA